MLGFVFLVQSNDVDVIALLHDGDLVLNHLFLVRHLALVDHLHGVLSPGLTMSTLTHDGKVAVSEHLTLLIA